MTAKYPKPNKVLQRCSVTDEEVLEYFPPESRCNVDHDKNKVYQMKMTLQVKKILPAIMLVAPYSAYPDEQEWGKGRQLVLVDWDSNTRTFLVAFLEKGKKSTATSMVLHDGFGLDEYCLTITGSRWEKILKYATIPSQFKTGKFLYTDSKVELLKKKQVSDKPQVWVQFGEDFNSDIEWANPCRSVIEWRKPDQEGDTGIWFENLSYSFYDKETGFYHRHEGSEHVVRIVSRVKLVEK